MTISELLAEIGDEEICYQNLMQDVSNITNGKKDSRISFFTSTEKGYDLAHAIASNSQPKYTACIVWVPTEKLQGVLKQNLVV